MKVNILLDYIKFKNFYVDVKIKNGESLSDRKLIEEVIYSIKWTDIKQLEDIDIETEVDGVVYVISAYKVDGENYITEMDVAIWE